MKVLIPILICLFACIMLTCCLAAIGLNFAFLIGLMVSVVLFCMLTLDDPPDSSNLP